MQDQGESFDDYKIKDIKTSVLEFRDYWKEIDIIKEFKSSEIEGILNQWVRKSIINILSEGREIKTEQSTRKIYVMNANELLQRINQEVDKSEDRKKVKKSNLYFHLNKLEEGGLIETVGYIPVKNRLISYYGRTARVFLIDYDKDKSKYSILNKPELLDLISSINPSMKRQKIKKITEKLNKLMYKKTDTNAISNWIETYESELRDSEIDIRQLHNLFHKILTYNDKTIQALREFGKMLDLDIEQVNS